MIDTNQTAGRVRKPLAEYRAVFFDVGDTLLTIPNANAVMKTVLDRFDFVRDEEQIGEYFTAAYKQLYYGRSPDEYAACSPETDRAFWVALYRHMLERLGAMEHTSEEVIHEWCHVLYDVFTAPEHYVVFPDVIETLDELRSRGFRLGVISNFADSLPRILKAKGLAPYFDPMIVSTEVGLEKPDPAIFRLALERSGLPADQVLYVGDHEINDVYAPGLVGIDAVRILRYDYHEGEGIRSLKELFDR